MNLRRDHSNILFGFLEEKSLFFSARKQGEEEGVGGETEEAAPFFKDCFGFRFFDFLMNKAVQWMPRLLLR